MSKSIRLVTAVFLEAGLGLGFCRAASAGTVWDDAFGWYRGGFDFNGNGIVEKFDFLDQRHPSTAGTKQHSQLGIPDGAGRGDVCFRTGVDVFSPMMNRTIPGQQCVELPSCIDDKLPGLREFRGLPDFGKVAGFPDIPYSKIGLYADTWRGSDLELR